MKYQKIIILLGNTTNQLSKFRTANSIEIKDDQRRTQSTNIQTNLKPQC